MIDFSYIAAISVLPISAVVVAVATFLMARGDKAEAKAQKPTLHHKHG